MTLLLRRILRHVAVVLVSALTLTQTSLAGGVSFVTVEIDGVRVRPNLPVRTFPGQPVEICFASHRYHYLSSKFEEVAVHFWYVDWKDQIADSKLETIGVINPGEGVREVEFGGQVSRCFWWHAPAKEGSYELYSHKVPVIAAPASFRTEQEVQKLKDENLQQIGSVQLAKIHVSENYKPKALPYSLILKVNDKTPGAAIDIVGGVTDKPLEVSWKLRKSESASNVDVQYRYNFFPDTEWSGWTEADRVLIDYIARGVHEFGLQTRYRENEGEWVEVAQVSKIAFSINETLISRISAKGDRGDKGIERVDGIQGEVDPAWVNDELYGRSRAFLAAVQYYEDASFKPLPNVDNDVAEMTEALRSVGFSEFSGPPLNSDRATILTELQKFIAKTEEGDRIVLYFSMHGFESGTDRQNPYLATRDCDPSPLTAKTNCLALSDLEELVRYAMSSDEGGKKAKHALIILDACSVGMGLVRKNSVDAYGFVEQAIAGVPGAHIMTAGLADQEALMDNEAKISVFTRALVAGLRGAADVIPDNVITLSELEVYVRREVALKTDAKQTPMVNDIVGAGQMIFSSTPATAN